MTGLVGRTFIVTGAGRGLGRSYAEVLVACGANIVAGDIEFPQDTSPGPCVERVVADVGRPGTAERLVQSAVERFGAVDGAVANAGAILSGSAWETDDDVWHDVVDSHLYGSFALTRALAREWRLAPSTGARSLVLATSGAGLHAVPGQVAYVAAKAGVAALAVALARELHKLEVRVNAVAPLARTPTIEKSVHLREAMAPPEQGCDQWDPLNVAHVVAYLLSDRCAFSGAVLGVVGASVEPYSGWDLRDAITSSAGRWTIDELDHRLAGFAPWRPSRTQLDHLYPAKAGGPPA